jgi:acetyl esterase/lipase
MTNSRHLVDPQLVDLADMLGAPLFTAENLLEQRNIQWGPPPEPDPEIVVDVQTVPGPEGAPDIDLYILRPAGATGPLPLVYHVHGGGYITGKAKAFAPRCAPLVKTLGCAVVSVEYRIAPETIFPGAVEDCYAGLAWCFANAEEQGFDMSRVGLKGESAGGGLAAALALLVRDRGEYTLGFQHLTYPMIDDRTGTTSEPHPYTGDYVWPVSNNRFGWEALLGRAPGGDDVSPYAAAARATDLSGLPPTFIYVGALDLFLEENIEYARRLARAGVPIEFHIYPGVFHAFEFQADSHIAQLAATISLAAMRRFLEPKS